MEAMDAMAGELFYMIQPVTWRKLQGSKGTWQWKIQL
jgi:hypothetical protein